MTDEQFISWLQSQDAVKLILVEVEDVLVNGVPTPFYFSNRTFISAPTDSPANIVYDPSVSGGVTFSESLNLDGTASVGFGDIELINLDGSRDVLLNHVWVNRSVSVYMGDPRFTKSDFRLIFKGHIDNLCSRTQGSLNMVIMDRLAKLAVPLSKTTIPDTEGTLNPLTFGECFNVPAVLSSPGLLEYTVHTSQIEDVIEVRDNGYPVKVTKDLANGKFKLDQAPYGKITASVQGSSFPAYTNNVAELISRIITDYGPDSSKLLTDIDYTNFANFAAENPQPVGLFVSSEVTKLEVCQRLAASVGGSLTCSSQGKIKIVKLELPASGAITEVYPTDMLEDTFSVVDKPSVKAAIRLNYCLNWYQHTEDIAAGIVPSNINIFKSNWYSADSANTAVAATYELPSIGFSEDSLMLTQADADNEADRRLALWSTQRYVYEAIYFPHLMLTELGDSIKIYNYRFGLDAGKTGTVVRIERDWFNSRIRIGVLV